MSFLRTPERSDAAHALFQEDLADEGYVMNVTRLWAYQPASLTALYDLMKQVTDRSFTLRERGILVAACAATAGDSYCSLAWGKRLAAAAGPDIAAAVLRGHDAGLNPREAAMAAWARAMTRNANATTPADVRALRSAGFTDDDIFAMTVYVGLRLALATVNDALGTLPDAPLHESTPPEIRAAVTYGRPVAARLPHPLAPQTPARVRATTPQPHQRRWTARRPASARHKAATPLPG